MPFGGDSQVHTSLSQASECSCSPDEERELTKSEMNKVNPALLLTTRAYWKPVWSGLEAPCLVWRVTSFLLMLSSLDSTVKYLHGPQQGYNDVYPDTHKRASKYFVLTTWFLRQDPTIQLRLVWNLLCSLGLDLSASASMCWGYRHAPHNWLSWSLWDSLCLFQAYGNWRQIFCAVIQIFLWGHWGLCCANLL